MIRAFCAFDAIFRTTFFWFSFWNVPYNFITEDLRVCTLRGTIIVDYVDLQSTAVTLIKNILLFPCNYISLSSGQACAPFSPVPR